jgi:hypothetical protein
MQGQCQVVSYFYLYVWQWKYCLRRGCWQKMVAQTLHFPGAQGALLHQIVAMSGRANVLAGWWNERSLQTNARLEMDGCSWGVTSTRRCRFARQRFGLRGPMGRYRNLL